jgi:hypothetical protein
MFGFNINGFSDEQCKIEITLGNQIIQQAQLPLVFARNEFINCINQLKQDSRPMKAKFSRIEYSEETNREIENSLTYHNNAYVSAFGEI